MFSNDQTAVAAVTGLYGQMMTTNLTLCNGAVTLYAGLSADELQNTTANLDLDPFYTNSIPATNATGIYSRLWSQGYRFIYHANAALEGLGASKTLTDTLRKQLQGEMLLARALSYFYLVNLFGDVPLETTTDYRINSVMSRTPATSVYDQIVGDLTKAKNMLPVPYGTSGRSRPNKWAAAALLARTYLYGKDWAKAESEADEVINAGLYSLTATTAIGNTFLATSPETIWQLSPVSTSVYTGEGNAFVPSSATVKPTYMLTAGLLNSFEPGDLRKAAWVKTNVVSGQSYSYPYKYKVRTGVAPYTEQYIVLRLAEQFLIRAEARIQGGNLSDAQADLNRLRNRAGLSNTVASSRDVLLAAVEQERRVELFCEWGHRWMDMIRNGKADIVFAAAKAPNWQSTDKLYPIPQQELDRNPALTQNPGY